MRTTAVLLGLAVTTALSVPQAQARPAKAAALTSYPAADAQVLDLASA